MTTANNAERALVMAGQAVLGVKGVAFLKPALGDLLRTAVTSAAALRSPATAPQRPPGIRITSLPGKGQVVEVHVVLLRGHRALDVTRAIRETVQAVHASTQPIPVHVTVTVTGIVSTAPHDQPAHPGT
ncbi:Asp23/Gls24 family envelope stress response protein [Streptomyces sp. NBC_00193]|uniref:Asp23/Gls24 family envelope stress response protein n=1 Tax=unclassified Streptomyces TaxID=2593676 RepID=UPI00225567E6|nr:MULTISPECIES: Asp23/Gls24 family envelope stress response protein [unclassified Streptomyces]MCX5129489.1 Asp23/Gls24 family envelope stress response protein [Streptomyces sp. NBC_00347]MCX5300565.1 Asp23/Gls24 family envelope stress response protein [Streptomyces sp. NBC_00193]